MIIFVTLRIQIYPKKRITPIHSYSFRMGCFDHQSYSIGKGLDSSGYCLQMELVDTSMIRHVSHFMATTRHDVATFRPGTIEGKFFATNREGCWRQGDHQSVPSCTLPETNIAPENEWLEYRNTSFLLGWPIFKGYILV